MRDTVRGSMRFRAVTGLLLAAALVLSACSGDDDPAPASNDTSPSPTEAESPYLEVPDGVTLTAQGTELGVGDTATIAYEPRQEQVGALDVTVKALEKASFDRQFQGWRLKAKTRSTTPYFVSVRIKNVGATDLGGRKVPLYILDGRNTLVEYSTFRSTFKPCASELFPKKFAKGDKLSTCLVYLSPKKGDLTAVSFRPSQDFDPIIWSGDVTRVGASDAKKKGPGKKDGKGKPGDENPN